MNNKELFIKQLDGLTNEFDILKSKSQDEDLSDLGSSVDLASLMAKSIATIRRIVGDKSEYYNSIQIAFNDKRNYFYNGLIIKHIIGVVKALRADLSNDYLKSLSELIHSDVFSDYLEMANYLLTEGYKDPAAVIAGSTLESHLRKLCEKHSIEIEYENNKGKLVPKKADSLNSDLSKADIFNKTFQKQITAWLDLRNNAAHGKYEEYSNEEVKLMNSGIMNFILTFPA